MTLLRIRQAIVCVYRKWPIKFEQDNQVACYKTHTTSETHRMIRDNMHLSVHIQETKKGQQRRHLSSMLHQLTFEISIGPRYCPSLEAKVTRFAQRDQHIVWLEPEGYDSGRQHYFPLFCRLISLKRFTILMGYRTACRRSFRRPCCALFRGLKR